MKVVRPNLDKKIKDDVSILKMIGKVANTFDADARRLQLLEMIREYEYVITSEVDLKKHNLIYKIRDHSLSKIPLLLICGKKEVDSNTVTIRRLDSNKQENMELNSFLKKFSALNKAPSNI